MGGPPEVDDLIIAHKPMIQSRTSTTEEDEQGIQRMNFTRKTQQSQSGLRRSLDSNEATVQGKQSIGGILRLA